MHIEVYVMDARANKNRLIETLRIERARWDMLLVQIDTSKMTVPGVEGHLSVRDIIADVVQQEKWVARNLRDEAMEQRSKELEAQGLQEPPAEERGPVMSVGELMDESRRAFEQIVRTLMGLPAEAIFSPQQSEWTQGDAVSAVVPAHTVEHYQRYYGSIRRWMTKRRRRRASAPSSG
jgi:Protein of unknown function (DUF1706)